MLDPRRKRLYSLLATTLFVLVCVFAAPKLLTSPSETPSPAPTTSNAENLPSIGAMLARLTAGTVVVLALCAGSTYWIARRHRGKVPPNVGPMSIVGSMPIGRGVVYLVRVGDQRLLASADATGLRSLVQLPANVELDEGTTIIAERVTVPAELLASRVTQVAG